MKYLQMQYGIILRKKKITWNLLWRLPKKYDGLRDLVKTNASEKVE